MTRSATQETGAGGARLSREPVVVCQNLTKTYKDFWMRARARAVTNLSFEIRPREVFGLLGPNGSGKSTTIKMMLGLLRPTSGRVAIFGKASSDVAIKSRVGYLPETSGLYRKMKVSEQLILFGQLRGLSAADAAAQGDGAARVRRGVVGLRLVDVQHGGGEALALAAL